MSVNLADALAHRMALIAQALARRANRPGDWAGYDAEAEPLVGRVTRPPELGNALTVDYHRPGHPGATIAMAWLTMVDVRDEARDKPVVIESGITERKRFPVRIPAGVKVEREFEHTFSRTHSFAERAQRAWEVAAKASLGVGVSGVNASVEASAKYGEDLAREATDSETVTDRLFERLTFTGPIDTVLEAYRAHDRMSQTIRARCDFDGKLYIRGGAYDGPMEFTTFRSQFLPVAKRLADDSIYGYAEFMRDPLTDAEIAAIEAPSDKVVEFVVEFDDVEAPTLREVAQ